MKSFLKKHYSGLAFLILLSVFSTGLQAGKLYWKASATSNVFTNVSNWDVGFAGSGIVPAGITSTDSVYFTTTSTFTSLSVPGGQSIGYIFCTAPSAYTLNSSGTFTIFGSINSNGSLTVNASTLNFSGSGSYTLDMGSSAARLFGDISFNSGSYTMVNNALSLGGHVTFADVCTFNSSGFPLFCQSYAFFYQGAGVKNFSNSIINISSGSGNAYIYMFSAGPAINFTGSTIITGYIYVNPFTGPCNLGNVYLKGFGNSGIESTNACPFCSINIDTLRYDSGAINWNMGAGGISVNHLKGLGPAVHTLGTYSSPLRINTSVSLPATCASTFFYSGTDEQATLIANGITFPNTSFWGVKTTGAGFTASGLDLGFNTGITFTAPPASSTFYWIGGNGNWNDPAHWSHSSGGTPAGCVPGFRDDVIFDINSFSNINQTVTILPSSYGFCRNVTWANPTGWGNIAGSGYLQVTGNVDMTGCNSAANFGGGVRYLGSGSQTIKMGGKYFPGRSHFMSVGGTYTLLDDYGVSNVAGGSIYLQSGTLRANGKNIYTSAFYNHSLSQNPMGNSMPLARTLDISNSKMYFRTLSMSGGKWDVYTDNFTLNSANSTIIIDPLTVGSPSEFFLFAILDWQAGNTGLTYNNLTVNSPSPTQGIYFYGVPGDEGMVNSFNLMRFINANAQMNNAIPVTNVDSMELTPGYTYSFGPHATLGLTVTGAIYTTSTCKNPVNIQSFTVGSRARIIRSLGTPMVIDAANVKDINAVNDSIKFLSGTDLGNNLKVGVGVPAARTFYWVGGNGNWNDCSHWSINVNDGVYPTGNNSGCCLPTQFDNLVFNNLSFTATGQTVTIPAGYLAYCKDITWTSGVSSFSPSFSAASSAILNIYGSVLLNASMNVSGFSSPINFQSSGTVKTLDFANLSFTGILWPIAINFYGNGSDQWKLLSKYQFRNTTTTLNNNTNFYSNNYQMDMGGLQSYSTLPRTIKLGTSVVNMYAYFYSGFQFMGMDFTNLTASFDSTTINVIGGMNAFGAFYGSTSNPKLLGRLNSFVNAGGTLTLNNYTGNSNAPTFKSIYSQENISFSFRNFNVDTLKLGPGGKTCTINSGDTLFIKDT